MSWLVHYTSWEQMFLSRLWQVDCPIPFLFWTWSLSFSFLCHFTHTTQAKYQFYFVPQLVISDNMSSLEQCPTPSVFRSSILFVSFLYTLLPRHYTTYIMGLVGVADKKVGAAPSLTPRVNPKRKHRCLVCVVWMYRKVIGHPPVHEYEASLIMTTLFLKGFHSGQIRVNPVPNEIPSRTTYS